MDRRLLALLAFACGATVANNYYAQPLLPEIAAQFDVAEGTAGLLVTISQLSYAVGLVFLVPLGDLRDRRVLSARLLLVCAAALLLAALAPGFAVLGAALALAGVTSVVVQVLIPFASTLAPPGERGRVLGAVTSGALTGVLLARTLSGSIASLAGWRAPFALAAVAMALLSLALWRALPRVQPRPRLRYGQLLASTARLVREQPLLRRRMVYGSCGFASFSLVWTTVGFQVSAQPFELGEGEIGLLGLAGLAGALGAQVWGRISDRGVGSGPTGSLLVVIGLSWAVLAAGADSLPLIVAGLIFLDFGIQGQNVLSQGITYALGPEIASRVASSYVTGNFAGGAIGSLSGAVAWSVGGWGAVCGVGAAFSSLALAFWLRELRVAL